MNEATKKNDYEINYLMRKKFRKEKKKIKVSQKTRFKNYRKVKKESKILV